MRLTLFIIIASVLLSACSESIEFGKAPYQYKYTIRAGNGFWYADSYNLSGNELRFTDSYGKDVLVIDKVITIEEQ